jgi:HPt (histidine-containing phosphotransfer) domain-containing protein
MATDNNNTKSEKIIIRVDSDLEDLIPGFLENRSVDIQSILNALAQDDFASIVKLGHTMKGVGGGYGFDAITDIGRAIEQAAKDGNPEKIKQSLSELSDYLERIEIVFESS